MPYLSIFRMPTPMKITGRSSSITNSFVNSIIPIISPTSAEIKQALDILGMTLENFHCSYCGLMATEWDHLRPLVVDKKPTGYISEIHNLVPSCGKCNQSKGNKNWRKWIISDAKLSPKSKDVKDLDSRIQRLSKFEDWGTPTQVNFEEIVGKDKWRQHWDNWELLQSAMKDSQLLADEIKNTVASSYTNKLSHDYEATQQQPIEYPALPEQSKTEILKVKRKLERWKNNKNQINATILNSFLKLEIKYNIVTVQLLSSQFEDRNKFFRNFNQMKIISEKNHAKIFEQVDDIVKIWEPIKSYIKQYELTMELHKC